MIELEDKFSITFDDVEFLYQETLREVKILFLQYGYIVWRSKKFFEVNDLKERRMELEYKLAFLKFLERQKKKLMKTEEEKKIAVLQPT